MLLVQGAGSLDSRPSTSLSETPALVERREAWGLILLWADAGFFAEGGLAEFSESGLDKPGGRPRLHPLDDCPEAGLCEGYGGAF